MFNGSDCDTAVWPTLLLILVDSRTRKQLAADLTRLTRSFAWRNDGGRHLHCRFLDFLLFFDPFLSTWCLPFLYDFVLSVLSEWLMWDDFVVRSPSCLSAHGELPVSPTLFLAGLLQCVTLVSASSQQEALLTPALIPSWRMLHILLCCATQAHMGLCVASLRMRQWLGVERYGFVYWSGCVHACGAGRTQWGMRPILYRTL